MMRGTAVVAIALWCLAGCSRDSASQDLAGLRAMTTWNITQPNGPNSCAIEEPNRYQQSRLDHELGSNIDNARATHQVSMLDQQVTDYLKQHHWAVMNAPDCYRKQGIVVHTMKTQDGFSVIIYLPRTGSDT